jgi:para-nitrobenzyl esterase
MSRITRRGVLSVAAAASLAPWLRARAAGAAARPVTVDTTAGRVEGLRTAGVCTFRGIPYGASTAGPGRFRPPRPVDPWGGTLEAFSDRVQAPQHEPGVAPRTTASSAFDGIDPDWQELPESEDCLRLNVWTPAIDGGKRPVMVWIHGGGFVAGSAAGAWQDGGRLSQRGDVVVVSPNHRINVLGHLFVDHIDANFAGAGNAGVLDLVLALTWVRDNIRRFGGDPDNVTIFGQSGGGQKVSVLMAMPAAAGLFHKAAIQSGPAPRALEPAYAAQMADRLLGRLGVGKGELQRLRSLPLPRIMKAYFEVMRETGGYGVMGVLQGFAPVVDGTTLPQHPFSGGAPKFSADVPLLIGSTRTEMTLYTLLADPAALKMDEQALRERMVRLFGPDAAHVQAAYRSAHPSLSPWELYGVITGDWPTRIYSIRIAEAKAALGRAPVFMYRTDWRTPVAGGSLLSPHAIDIAFVLDTTPHTASFDGGGPETRLMTKRMCGAWLNLARSGRPNADSLPAWPPYGPDTGRATMLFDSACRVVGDPDGADRRALEQIMADR